MLTEISWPSIFVIISIFLIAWYSLESGYRSIKKAIEDFEGDVRFKKISSSNNFLAIHLKEISLNFNEYPKALVCKEDPVYYLSKKTQAKFKHLYAYKFGQNFTGIALIITFSLIGIAVYKIGHTLQAPLTDKTTQDLGIAITQLSSKFIISVLGIAFSIVYQFISHRIAARLYEESKNKLRFLSKADFRLHEDADLDYQRQQAEGALQSAESIKQIDVGLAKQVEQNNLDVIEIKELLSDLQKIDVKVGDLAEGVTKQLENMIDRSIGERLTLLLNAQKESTEKIASELGKVLADTMGKELEATFAKLAETLPSIISNGASDSSMKMSQTFEKMSDSLPNLLESMNGVMIQVKNQQNDSVQSSKKINDDLLLSLSSTIEKFNTLSASNTEFQTNLLSKVTSTIDSVNESSRKNTLETQQSLTSSISNFSDKMSNGAEHLVTSINQVKDVVVEIEKMSTALKMTNSTTLLEVNNTLVAFKGAAENINKYNQEIGASIKSLAGISIQLSQAPELTRNLIIDTKKASDTITESYQNLEKMFVSGVGQIANVYASKIQHIEDHAKSIRTAYEGASVGLSQALEPLEDLSENIEKLNKTIQKQSAQIDG